MKFLLLAQEAQLVERNSEDV